MSDPRPLGPANLVTLEEARAELRVGREAVHDLVARLRPVRVGRFALYVWGEILEVARPAAAPSRPAGGPKPWTLP